jgi:hypothetical protein
MYDETRATLRTVGGGMGFSRPLFRCLGYANRKPILRHIAAMWLERPQKTRKFGSMCPWIRSVIASNLARAERRDAYPPLGSTAGPSPCSPEQ